MRHVRPWLLLPLTCLLMMGSVLAVPLAQPSPAGAVPGGLGALNYGKGVISHPPGIPVGDGLGYRGLTGLDFDEVTDIAVSESSNRLVVAGDDRVEIYQLDNFVLVATVEGIHGARDLRIDGDRVFVLARTDGVIREISLAEGSVVSRWETGASGVWSIDVSPTHVWFAHVAGLSAGIGRVERASGLVEAISGADDPTANPVIRVRDGHLGEIYVGSGTTRRDWLHRYEVTGTTATPAGETAGELSVSSMQAMEVSADGATVWSAAVRPLSLVKVDGTTLAESVLEYVSSDYPSDVWVGPADDSPVVLAVSSTGRGRVWLFDSGTGLTTNSFSAQGWLSAVASSSDEVFAVSGDVGSQTLHGWQHDYAVTDRIVTISLAGHGTVGGTEATFRVLCGGMDETFRGSYGRTYQLTIPDDETACRLIPRTSGTQSILLGKRINDTWEFVDHHDLYFDPTKHSGIAIADFFRSPDDDVLEFVKQSHADVTGQVPEYQELRRAVGRVGLSDDGRGRLVVDLMDSHDGYERVQAPIGRLYRAFFLRDSDQGGHEYWAGQFANGVSIPWIAEYFALSEEFELRYGDLDDREFVALVYRNVMDREPDQGGYDYWLNQMSKGLTRGELMIYFSDSPEYRNYASGRVFVVYAARMLEHREPSAVDIEALVDIFDRSGREAVVEAILNASPYFERFWKGGASGDAGLRDSGLPPMLPECFDCPSARDLFEEFAG